MRDVPVPGICVCIVARAWDGVHDDTNRVRHLWLCCTDIKSRAAPVATPFDVHNICVSHAHP